MKVGLIGDGAIGRYVAKKLEEDGTGIHVRIVRAGRAQNGRGLRVSDSRELPGDTGLMVDCAGPGALAEHGPGILERGIDLVTLSVGALADAALHDRLRDAARSTGARLHLASGAIGALDCLRAAAVGGLDSVTYTGRKPPSAWMGSPAEERVELGSIDAPATHFTGTARQAAIDYPKNANVAAAVALAGIGFDETRVELVADPAAGGNIHEVRAKGAFGAFNLRIEGKALPENPRSSALAAMSAVAAVRCLDSGIKV